jgi:DNA-binding protein HU-beta
MIKQDIVHHVIERTGLPRAKAEAAVDTVFEGLKQALTAGERIELRGFGVFSVRARGKELHVLETGEPAK